MREPGSPSEWLGPPFRGPAGRLVSLVPSLTHAVFELGAGDAVVGRVLALAPDAVLANREENTRRRVERIAVSMPVLVTDPRSPADIPALWRELGAVCGREAEGERLAREVEAELVPPRTEHRPRFVYWIWRDPWMAAGHGTYISELLVAAGWRNALPPDRTRYPKVDPDEIDDLAPEVMLFSSEPYEFELPRDLDAFPGFTDKNRGIWRLPGGPAALAVDGRLFSWYPSLTAAGLRTARELVQPAGGINPDAGIRGTTFSTASKKGPTTCS
jgi:ABC-type hemin transport system substrate-binding protein